MNNLLPSQVDLVKMKLKGMSTKEIALNTNTTPKNIRTRFTRIFKKLKVKSTVELFCKYEIKKEYVMIENISRRENEN